MTPEEPVYVDLNARDLLGPEPTYPEGWMDDPMGGLANWYAPDGVTNISTREANELLGRADRHVACSLVGDWRVCTPFLVIDMALNLSALGYPGVRILWETVAFPDNVTSWGAPRADRDAVEDLTGQRYASLRQAQAGHLEVVAAVAEHLGVDLADVVHEDLTGNPIAEGRRDWRTS